MAPSTSKKRVSKKKKISWRKHCDTKDVENFLEDKRLEERLGFAFADKPDDELFLVDTVATDDKKDGKDFSKNLWGATETACAEKKSKRQDNLSKPLKCLEVLIPQSAVQDPISKRNRVRTPEERKHPLLKKLETDRRKHGILKAKEIDSLRNRTLAEARRKNRPKKGEFATDLWGADSGGDADPLGGNYEWLNPTTRQHTLKNTGQLKKRVPKSLMKKSCLPAVEPPHPGMSYNPTLEDHQQLLQAVANKELGLIKEEQHLNRVTTKMFTQMSRHDKDKSWLTEMSEGLPKAQEAIKDEIKEKVVIDDKDNEYTTVNPPVKNKKKTVQQRKKQKAAQREEQQRQLQRVEKKKISDIYRLRLLEKHFQSRDHKLAVLREKREKVKAIKAKEPKRLSKTKFEAPELDFNMPMDIRGSLRCIKMEGSLLNDRFKSLQRRNVVEPSIKHKAKKGKKKVFQKASHRMDWEVT